MASIDRADADTPSGPVKLQGMEKLLELQKLKIEAELRKAEAEARTAVAEAEEAEAKSKKAIAEAKKAEGEAEQKAEGTIFGDLTKSWYEIASEEDTPAEAAEAAPVEADPMKVVSAKAAPVEAAPVEAAPMKVVSAKSKSKFRTKTRYCYCKYWREGKCAHPETCSYAHGPHELVEDPNNPSYMTKMCKNGEKCPYKTTCNFAHTTRELWSKVPNFKTELCRNKECQFTVCRYAHGREELRCPEGLEGKWRTTMCRNILEGKECPFGESCRFAHTQDEKDEALMAERRRQSQL